MRRLPRRQGHQDHPRRQTLGRSRPPTRTTRRCSPTSPCTVTFDKTVRCSVGGGSGIAHALPHDRAGLARALGAASSSATSRAMRSCSAPRSPTAAPPGPTTSGSSFSAMRCSICSSRSTCTAPFRTADEGDLSRLRARVVSGESLAEVAAALGLGEALQLGPGSSRPAAFAASRSWPMRSRRCAARSILDGGLDGRAQPVIAAAVRRAHRRASGARRRSRMPRRACRSSCRRAACRCRATRS